APPADGRAVRRARRADPHPHVERAAADLDAQPVHDPVRDPQPDRSDLPRRRGAGDGDAPGPYRRAAAGRAAAAAHPRHGGIRIARGAAQPHLAPDRGSAAMTRAARWSKRLAVALALVALWELAYRLGVLDPLIFGSPSLIVAAAGKDGPAFL